MSQSRFILILLGILIISLLFATGCILTITSPPSLTSLEKTLPSDQARAASIQTTDGSQLQVTPVELPSFAQIIDVVKQAVVKIDTIGSSNDSSGLAQGAPGSGSGWVVDTEGFIVTDNHVIENASKISVTLSDGKQLSARVVNARPEFDLAVIKIDANKLPTLKVGDASKLRVGDWVISIGNPLGQGISVKQGIVSRLGVTVPFSQTLTYRNMIEISAMINPGNSGGPVFNLAGEVVGITAIKVSDVGIEGIGYAISMTDALPVIRQLTGK